VEALEVAENQNFAVDLLQSDPLSKRGRYFVKNGTVNENAR
jgi:hypothetical protein